MRNTIEFLIKQISPEVGPQISEKLLEELSDILLEQFNAFSIIRFLDLENQVISLKNPSEQESFDFLTTYLPMLLSIPDKLAAFIEAINLSIEPSNEYNLIAYMLDTQQLIYSIDTYDPEKHGLNKSEKPIRRWKGKDLITLENQRAIVLRFKQDKDLEQKIIFLADSIKGSLLHELLKAKGEWVTVDHLMSVTGYDRTAISTNINSLTNHTYVRPRKYWSPITVESHKPHKESSKGSGSTFVTHYRLVLDSELRNAVIEEVDPRVKQRRLEFEAELAKYS